MVKTSRTIFEGIEIHLPDMLVFTSCVSTINHSNYHNLEIEMNPFASFCFYLLVSRKDMRIWSRPLHLHGRLKCYILLCGYGKSKYNLNVLILCLYLLIILNRSETCKRTKRPWRSPTSPTERTTAQNHLVTKQCSCPAHQHNSAKNLGLTWAHFSYPSVLQVKMQGLSSESICWQSVYCRETSIPSILL